MELKYIVCLSLFSESFFWNDEHEIVPISLIDKIVHSFTASLQGWTRKDWNSHAKGAA